MENAISVNVIKCSEENPVYSSLVPETDEERKTLYNATVAPGMRLSQMIGKTIDLVHVYVELIELTDQQTGETYQAPRIVLIDKDGSSYACVSGGILRALNRIYAIFGPAPWKDGLIVEVQQLEVRGNRVYTLAVK